jgi:hypothetical protein
MQLSQNRNQWRRIDAGAGTFWYSFSFVYVYLIKLPKTANNNYTIDRNGLNLCCLAYTSMFCQCNHI